MDTWSADRGWTTIMAIMAAVQPWLREAEGVTVSGGEPFDQPEALKARLSGLRRKGVGDIFVYSGYPLEAARKANVRACAKARRAKGSVPRAVFLATNNVAATKPWEAAGLSRATWYRRNQKLASQTTPARRQPSISETGPT